MAGLELELGPEPHVEINIAHNRARGGVRVGQDGIIEVRAIIALESETSAADHECIRGCAVALVGAIVDVDVPIRHELKLAIGALEKEMFAIPTRCKRSFFLGLRRWFGLVDHGGFDPKVGLDQDGIHQMSAVGGSAIHGLHSRLRVDLGDRLYRGRTPVGGLSLGFNQLLHHRLQLLDGFALRRDLATQLIDLFLGGARGGRSVSLARGLRALSVDQQTWRHEYDQKHEKRC